MSRSRLAIGAAGVAAVLLAAHLRVEAAGSGFQGPLLLLDHLYQVVLAGAFTVLCSAVGHRMTTVSGLEDLGPVDRFVVSIPLGAGLIALVFLGLGSVGVLAFPVVLGILALCGWWARREIAGVPELVSRVVRGVPAPVLVVAGLVGAALILSAVAPPTDWDSLMYHLHLPERFLEEGGIFRPDDTQHVAFVGLAHMLYMPLLELGGTSAPALLSLLFGLLLPLAVYRLARRVAGLAASEMAGVAVWGTAAVAMVAVTARVDVILLVFLTVGHLAVCEAIGGEGGRRWLLLAAVLLGLAVGVKYQAGGYVLALAPLVVWSVVEGSAGTRVGWRGLLVFGGVLAAVALPWFVKNWIVLDAPFYPFLAERQLPTWLADLHGSRSVPEAVGSGVFGALKEIRRPFGVVEAYLHPGRLSPEGEAAHYRPSPLLLLIPAWVAWLRDRDLAWLLVPGLGYVALILVISPRTNLRYLLPAIPPLTVAASVMAVRIVDRGLDRFGSSTPRRDGREGEGDSPRATRHRHRLRAAAVALALASLVPTGMSLYQWLPGEVSLSHLAGAESRRAYLSQRRNPAMVTEAGLTDFGDRPLPEDPRVLMMFEARELHFTVPAYQDPLLTNWALLAPIRRRLDCLRATEITHVLVGTGVLGYYFDRGLSPETVRWPSFLDFADRCLERELEVPGHVLYRVPAADGENGSSDPGTGERPVPP